jgi:hypothetical protein
MPPTLAQAEALVDALSPEDKLRLRGYLDGQLTNGALTRVGSGPTGATPTAGEAARDRFNDLLAEIAAMPRFESATDLVSKMRR